MPAIAEATATPPAGLAETPVAAIMARTVALLPDSLTCAQAVASLAAQADAETIYQACATDPDGGFAGLVSLRACLVRPGDTPLADILARPALTLRETDDAGVSAHRLLEAGMDGAPVLDARGRVTGLVTAEAARRFLLDELEETTDSFAGLVGEPKGRLFRSHRLGGLPAPRAVGARPRRRRPRRRLRRAHLRGRAERARHPRPLHADGRRHRRQRRHPVGEA